MLEFLSWSLNEFGSGGFSTFLRKFKLHQMKTENGRNCGPVLDANDVTVFQPWCSGTAATILIVFIHNRFEINHERVKRN